LDKYIYEWMDVERVEEDMDVCMDELLGGWVVGWIHEWIWLVG
jgi:predicted transcriptional regulator